MIRRSVLFCLGLWASAAQAQDISESALSAAAELRVAVEALQGAQSADDRVSALTETITAYEKGLGALRDGAAPCRRARR